MISPHRFRSLARLSALTFCVALVAAGCGGDDAASTAPGTKDAAEPTQVSGASLFASKCAGCHGEDGGGMVGPSLKATSLDQAAIVGMVTNGMGGMPSFEGQLSKEEIDAVAEHVATEIKQ